MKVIVQFSGGKDSLASLIWAVENYGKRVIAVFCDTFWEHEFTYDHIHDVIAKLGIELVELSGKKSFIDLAKEKGRFPSTKARFCTEDLKVIPFIDWVLDQKNDLLIIQGIRKDESLSRSKMQDQCTFFKYYFEPYRINKKGKPLTHSYRKKDVKQFVNNYVQDVFRPIFDWSAKDVFDFISEAGFEANPLYKLGFKRVGCFPCIMCTHQEIKEIANTFPETVQRLHDAESEVGRSFFPPDYIPRHQCANGQFPTVDEVIKYVTRESTLPIFEEKSCKSFYNLCE